MTLKCARCDWRGEDDEAEEHARDSGHMRCMVCQRRFLSAFEAQTCGMCIGRVRADLADIVAAYAEIEPSGVNNLTLLGDGTMQRVFRQYETDSYLASAHPLARPDERAPKPIRDELLGDPLPVLPALVSWEDYIREHYPSVGKGAPDPTLTEVVDWLSSNLDARLEIAQTFPAFDEFAAEIRRHWSSLRHAASLMDDPLEAPATCFECHEPLLRTYGDAGLTDDWTCSGCRKVYTQHDYFFMLRVQQVDAPGEWRPLAVAAWLVDRPFRTVQTWARNLVIAFACDVETQRRQVWMPDVKAADSEEKIRAAKRAEDRERRKRKREEAEAREAS